MIEVLAYVTSVTGVSQLGQGDSGHVPQSFGRLDSNNFVPKQNDDLGFYYTEQAVISHIKCGNFDLKCTNIRLAAKLCQDSLRELERSPISCEVGRCCEAREERRPDVLQLGNRGREGQGRGG